MSHTVRADPQYDLLYLGTYGGLQSKAYGVNDSGQVVGWAEMADGTRLAFRTQPWSAINPATDNYFGTPPPLSSAGLAINATGQTVGDYRTAGGDRAYLYSGVAPANLGTLGGNWSYAFGLNASGQVVGGSATKTSVNTPNHAFLYSGGTMKDLGTLLGSGDSWAWGINSGGRVVGYSTAGPYIDHAFQWIPTVANGTTGTMSDLGTLGGNYSYAWDINDAGQIVGMATTTFADDVSHAFLHTGGPSGTMTDLGTLGGTYSEAFAINPYGVVVGSSTPASGGTTAHAFVYRNGAIQDLNTLIDPTSANGLVLNRAQAVNSSGAIVGWAVDPLEPVIDSSKKGYGFLLIPRTKWGVDADGVWSSQPNWFGPVPAGVDKAARFTDGITLPRTVTVDTPLSVGSAVFANTAAYTIAGAEAITLSTTTGPPSITVTLGSHTISAPLVLTQATEVGVTDPVGTLTLSGDISGAASASVTKSGPGTLLLTGSANTWSGGTSLQGGTLEVTSAGSLGPGPVTLEGGIFRVSANVTLLNDVSLPSGTTTAIDVPSGAGLTATVAGTVTGSGGLIKSGGGTLALSGTNDYAGPTRVDAGVLSASAAGNLGAATAAVVLNGGALAASAPINTGRPLDVTTSGGTLDASAAAVVFDGAGDTSLAGTLNVIGGPVTFARTGGAVSIGPGVSLNVASAATLNLAGTTSVTGSGATLAAVANNGTLNVDSPTLVTTVTGTGSTSVGAAGSLTADSLRQNGLTIAGGGAISLRAGGGTSALEVLDIDAPGGGKLDVAPQAPLIVDYGDTSPAETVRQYLLAGRNGGTWNGTGGIVSSAAAADLQQRTAVGWTEASDLGLTEFAGEGFTGNAILLKYTWYGDTTLDGVVDADDYVRIDRGFAMGLAGWVNGDFDYSGAVTSDDYLLIDAVYLSQSGALSPEFLAVRESQFGGDYVAQLVALVPEPGSGALVATLPFLSLRRRHRMQRTRSSR